MSAPDVLTQGLIAIVERALGDARALVREEVRRGVEQQVQLALVLVEVAKSLDPNPIELNRRGFPRG